MSWSLSSRDPLGHAGYRLFRFRRHGGHGRTCHWFDPVAVDPTETLARGFCPAFCV